MDISSISNYYELRPLTVKPSQLLLDPNNPRIILDVNTDRKFTVSELASADVQDYVLSVINKRAHHIAELIRGIAASGFIDKGDDLIVKRAGQNGKFLVIEGNRRTTAIKHLLSDADKLKPAVRDTLANLRVKEFIYKPNREFDEAAVIDILLGTIHITGRLPWGALEKAYYIYNSYLREMKKYRHVSFEYVVECSREVSTLFNLSVRAVRKEILVYRVYEQLKRHGYDVQPHHFSLIEMAVADRWLSEHYFEVNTDRFELSSRGVSRFDKLCVRRNRAVCNPKDFRAFSTIVQNGTEYELGLVESNEMPIVKVLDRVQNRMSDQEFLNRLLSIQSQLESLEIAACRGVKAELETIRRIKSLVDNRLWHLVVLSEK